MGPFDPPMVTAQGYNDPTQQTVGAPTAPMDQNAMLAELLRRRNAASKQSQMSAGNAQMWANDFQRPQFTQAIRGGAGQPDQVVVNWGDILGKGVSNYMGASERKKSLDSADEAKDISNQFMQTTLASDPTAQKLYGLTQAGMPGADKALANHLAPKKQTVADLTQFINGGGSPEMAAEIAKSKGIDPQIAFRAAEYQAKTAEEKRSSNFADKATLQEQKIQGKKDLAAGVVGKTGYTAAELAAMPVEERVKAAAASTGRETAESKERGKLKVMAEQQLPKTDYALQNINRVIDFAEKADYWPGNGGLKGNKLTTNTNNVNLRQAIYQLTLDANNGSLGTGFSNADRDFLMGAQADLESGNKSTVVAQLRNLITRLKQKQSEFRKNAGQAEPTAAASSPSGPSFDDQFPVGTFQGE